MINTNFFKFLFANLLILFGKSLTETVLISDENPSFLIEGETTGSCARQLNSSPQERNCRYGRCEQIQNGSDFVCHCDNFITGKKCDRLVVDTKDGCASNPCWGESLCITIEDTKAYKCLCPESRTGIFCHLRKNVNHESQAEIEKINESAKDFKLDKSNIFDTSSIYFFNFNSTTKPNNLLTTEFKNELSEDLFKNSKLNETDDGKFLQNENLSLNQTPMLSNLVPISSFLPHFFKSNNTCNSENCQFGKCLSNGTCDCSRPAFGEYCDQIDECLVLICKNGKCEKNKGCVCDQHFQGVLCDIPILTTHLPEKNPQTVMDKKNDTKHLSMLLRKHNFSTLAISLRKNSTLSPKTTSYISRCENGGLLIDNMCLCLNQFTGLRCENPPTFSDSVLNTKAPELESIEPIISKAFSKKLTPNPDKIEPKDQFMPIITLSRFNAKTKNLTSQRTIYWPWFECFPGESKVYARNRTNDKAEEKLVSELEVGDEILVVNDYDEANFRPIQFKFSRVVSFLHQIKDIDAKFIRLHYKDSFNITRHVTLTPRHLIYVKRMDKQQFEFMAALQVRVGDSLKKYDFGKKLHQIVNVTKVERVKLEKSGVFAPLTESGTLIVDNILTSCYSMAKYHGVAQFFFNLFSHLNYFVELTGDAYVYYSKFLYQIVKFLHLSNIFMNENLSI
ncbi:desert hedgehog [Brachionus plicatilis]|uniref:Desert hedgehog n=1 Tax=Brachionus plicatilis TaxID=10195 RepID=A0A3M7QEE8_BRAPC|nr:desert hedgehog [Brachionus plicatilis]